MSITGLPPYDPQNIFARILRGEIPCKRAHETPHTLAFHDINPLAPVHVLVIPKGAYCSAIDFGATATVEEIADFWRTVAATAQQLGLEGTGYRILANTGVDAGQEVPHFHMHIFGGRPLGRMVSRGADARAG